VAATEALPWRHDPRVRWLRTAGRVGGAAARNAGIEAARAELVAFLDDDDELLPGYLETMVASFDAAPSGTGFGWPAIEHLGTSRDGASYRVTKLWRPVFGSRSEASAGFLASASIGLSGLAVRTALLREEGGLDPALAKLHDTDLLIRLAAAADYFVVERPLVRRHHHRGEHLATKDASRVASLERLVAKHTRLASGKPGLSRTLDLKLARMLYMSGERSRARTLAWRALRSAPWRLDTWVAVALHETASGPSASRAFRHIAAARRRFWPFRRADAEPR
jgi:GT2 family glycosyltransferase